MNAQSDIIPAELRQAQAAAVDVLLSRRVAEGYWQGRLSSSALSTAVAAFALGRAGGPVCEPLVTRALDWLAVNRNDDGGWGDTTVSHSNLSTTVLCWCALSSDQAGEPHRAAANEAQDYIARACGSLDPDAIASAVSAIYGNDRTFSAPILTMAALAGRLGPEPACWRHVAQLPFELGALSHAMLRRLRLPVVSYALPALIAIGQVRHARRPTWNPLARLLRNCARKKTLAKLRDIQPDSGGYLEAAPLTSFVLMSLTALQGASGPKTSAIDDIAARAIAFLRQTVRPDGSWPIDTDLATWVTTLSVIALPEQSLDATERQALQNWLLDQQYVSEHPYTQAAPGGWAWTNLSGGVPDADDTPGALRALKRIAPDDPQSLAAAARGCRWLLDLQNADGGLPTFCRGWGRLPFDRSSDDLTAHALLAWTDWLAALPGELRAPVEAGIDRAVRFLIRNQGSAGEWTPLWFGNQDAPSQANPVYGTARVILALGQLAKGPASLAETPWRKDLAGPIQRGAEYLLTCQGPDGGFGSAPGVPACIEETALAVDALAGLFAAPGSEASQTPATPAERLLPAVTAGVNWLITQTRNGKDFPAAPIGLYFAKLWYFESLYPVVFTISALTAARRALGI